jgi:hypothetical protein
MTAMVAMAATAAAAAAVVAAAAAVVARLRYAMLLVLVSYEAGSAQL